MSQVKKNVATTTRQVAINAESCVASGLLLNHRGALPAAPYVQQQVDTYQVTRHATRSTQQHAESASGFQGPNPAQKRERGARRLKTDNQRIALLRGACCVPRLIFLPDVDRQPQPAFHT